MICFWHFSDQKRKTGLILNYFTLIYGKNQYNIVKLNKIKLKKEKKFKKRKNLKDILDCFIYTEETEMLLYIPVTLTKSLF